jgi:hypothetical protein
MTQATICHGCGYDLSGLGVRGRCPECGEYFDVTTGAGLEDAGGGASARDRRGERVARTLTLGTLVGSATVALVGGGVFAIVREDWRPAIAGGMIALLLAVIAANYYLGEK